LLSCELVIIKRFTNNFSTIYDLLTTESSLLIFYNLCLQNLVILEYAAFRKGKFDQYFKNANITSFTDPAVKRKLQILKDIGTAALSDTDLTALNSAKNRMSTVYNNAKICPFAKPNCNLVTEGLTLDPEIELLMASSENFDEMKFTWEQWHEKSGKLMRDDYKSYVDFMNTAAKANGTTA
jgi:peptidyl-dipeptidase A